MWADFIKTITELFNRIDKDDKELREKISILLYEMRLLLLSVSDNLEKNEEVNICSQTMESLTNEIYESLKNYIRVEDMDKTYKILKHCSHIDVEFDEYDNNKKSIFLKEVAEEIKSLSFSVCFIDN
jgi:hypothetical protein